MDHNQKSDGDPSQPPIEANIALDGDDMKFLEADFQAEGHNIAAPHPSKSFNVMQNLPMKTLNILKLAEHGEWL